MTDPTDAKRLTQPQERALRLIRRRKFCAHWLVHKGTLRALLRRRLIVPCGFYSVCLPENLGWTLLSYAHPEKAFDE